MKSETRRCRSIHIRHAAGLSKHEEETVRRCFRNKLSNEKGVCFTELVKKADWSGKSESCTSRSILAFACLKVPLLFEDWDYRKLSMKL